MGYGYLPSASRFTKNIDDAHLVWGLRLYDRCRSQSEYSII